MSWKANVYLRNRLFISQWVKAASSFSTALTLAIFVSKSMFCKLLLSLRSALILKARNLH